MRRWWSVAVAAADVVSMSPRLWLSGGLAWALTIGWLPLLVVVANPPSVAELTFLGAGFYSSGAWPWNAISILVAALAVVIVAFVLVAVAETTLAASIARRSPTAGELARVLAISVVSAAPALLTVMAAGIAFVLVALVEFTSPSAENPLLSTLGRIVPFGVAVLLAGTVGGVIHAAASRAVVLGGHGLLSALLGVPHSLRRAGAAWVVAAMASVLARLAYLGASALLLGVLWPSIATPLADRGMDAAVVPLLLGFVATWLCLVLGGGALHAWVSLTWTGLLGRPRNRTS